MSRQGKVLELVSERGPMTASELDRAMGIASCRSTIKNLLSTGRLFVAGEKYIDWGPGGRLVSTYSHKRPVLVAQVDEQGSLYRRVYRALLRGELRKGDVFLAVARDGLSCGRAVPAWFMLPPDEVMQILEMVDFRKLLAAASYSERLRASKPAKPA